MSPEVVVALVIGVLIAIEFLTAVLIGKWLKARSGGDSE